MNPPQRHQLYQKYKKLADIFAYIRQNCTKRKEIVSSTEVGGCVDFPQESVESVAIFKNEIKQPHNDNLTYSLCILAILQSKRLILIRHFMQII